MVVLARVRCGASGAAQPRAAGDGRERSDAHLGRRGHGAGAACARGTCERSGMRVRGGAVVRDRREHVVEHVAERATGSGQAGGQAARARPMGGGGAGLGWGPQEHVFVR